MLLPAAAELKLWSFSYNTIFSIRLTAGGWRTCIRPRFGTMTLELLETALDDGTLPGSLQFHQTQREEATMVALKHAESPEILARNLIFAKHKMPDFEDSWLPGKLCEAAHIGALAYVRYLLDTGTFLDGRHHGDTSMDYGRPISLAASREYIDVVRLLLNSGALVDDALARAAKGGYANVVELLLMSSLTPKPVLHDAFVAAGVKEHENVFRVFAKHGIAPTKHTKFIALVQTRKLGLDSMTRLLERL